MSEYKFATNALHGGQQPDPTTGARATPIYATTSFVFKDSEHAANLFALKEFGNIYTRIMNPTQAVAEQRIAILEGAKNPMGGLLLSSGQAAITHTILNITASGQNIVSSSSLYGGTYNLFHHTLPKLGISTRFVDPSDPKNLAKAIDENTRLIYAETLGNPKNDMLDIQAVAKIAHDNGIPLVIDNTVTTPFLCRPFEYGADIVVHSTTKFLGGHGLVIGGALVESGEFNWNNGKFPELSTPDPSYHGMNYWDAFGNHDGAVAPGIAFAIKARVQLLRDLGSCVSPFNAFLLLQGIETLHVRMPRHCENALKVAQWLDANPNVSWVNYPGLTSHASHELANKYLSGGYGALMGFGIKGGSEAGVKLINNVKLLSHLANIGDAKTLIIHPASTTHQQLTEAEQAAAGVTPDYIRLSVGIEDVGDIIADLDQAISASQRF